MKLKKLNELQIGDIIKSIHDNVDFELPCKFEIKAIRTIIFAGYEQIILDNKDTSQINSLCRWKNTKNLYFITI